MTKQLTEEEAKEYWESEKWRALPALDRAIFQLEQDRLAMPFHVFHRSVMEALDDPGVTVAGMALLRNEILQNLKRKKAERTIN